MSRLGSGSMADVYLAIQNSLNREVALKVPRFGSVEHQELLRKRFIQTVRINSKLNHPNIVQVIDVVHSNTTDAAVYELMRGPSLDRVLREETKLSLEKTVSIGVQLSDALAYLNGSGVVHRDIKPSNVMYAADNEAHTVKLVDFGVARDKSSENLTITGAQVGTVWYMSPEQFAHREEGSHWDLYALAMTLAELWLGDVPLVEKSQAAVIRRLLDEEDLRPWPLELRRLCPELVDLLDAALVVNAQRRLTDVHLFRMVLSALHRSETVNLGESSIIALNVDLERQLSGLTGDAAKRIRDLLNRNVGTLELPSLDLSTSLCVAGEQRKLLDETLQIEPIDHSDE